MTTGYVDMSFNGLMYRLSLPFLYVDSIEFLQMQYLVPMDQESLEKPNENPYDTITLLIKGAIKTTQYWIRSKLFTLYSRVSSH